MDPLVSKVYASIRDGDLEGTRQNVSAALGAGTDPAIVLSEGMIGAMREVGDRFEAGEYFVPEMLVAARAMQAAMESLKPLLQRGEMGASGKVLIGSVKGDLHDIGKNLVALMLEGAGFEVTDLGVDVEIEQFIAVARTKKPQIVALSALLTTTMPMMGETILAFQAAGLRSDVKFLVGGAPLTALAAEQMGADSFAPDASRAVKAAIALAKP